MKDNKTSRILITTIMILMITAISACAPAQNNTKPSRPEGTTQTPDTSATDKLACTIHEDCICQGIDKSTGTCFLGNKQYYDKNVDKTKDCPDFCTGIAGNFVIRCVNNQCMQTFQCMTDEDCASGQACMTNRCVNADDQNTDTGKYSTGCKTDDDCEKAGCSATLCRPKKAQPIFTTCEYKPEYACYRNIDCGCVKSACAWREDANFKTCIENARSKQGNTDIPV
jgi:eight-cysteine-cluster-containing protein